MSMFVSLPLLLFYVLIRRGSVQEFGKSVSFIVVVTAHSVYAPRPHPSGFASFCVLMNFGVGVARGAGEALPW